MYAAKHCSITAKSKQQGFTLLEVVLSTGLGALMLVAIGANLMQFNHHKLLSQTVLQTQTQVQLAVAQVLTDWRELCGRGVISGTSQSIGLMRLVEGRCRHYDYAFNATTHSLTRRRLGGRSSGFLSQVESMQLLFGVDSDGDCYVDQWRRSYQSGRSSQLHQVRVTVQLRIAASKQLRSNQSSLWLWHEEENLVINPVSFTWLLTDACS